MPFYLFLRFICFPSYFSKFFTYFESKHKFICLIMDAILDIDYWAYFKFRLRFLFDFIFVFCA